MNKLIKIFLTALLTILTILLVGGVYIHQPLPEGKPGQQAEALADSMLRAINFNYYRDSIEVLKWTFRGKHHYVWNKKKNEVNVKWDKYSVTFSPDSHEGNAWKNGKTVEGKGLEKIINKAWEYFANDSFWLVAPYKIRDPGTRRSIVETDEGPALLVTYTSGGVTPGDSYLWHLDDNYFPVSWQLWVKIIPIGGVKFTWQDWKTIGKASFAATHKGLISVNIADIEGH